VGRAGRRRLGHRWLVDLVGHHDYRIERVIGSNFGELTARRDGRGRPRE
jgi:hypothetical protein